MEALQTKAVAATVTEELPFFMADDDDLLNFSLEDGEVNTKNIYSISKGPSFSSSIPLHSLDDRSPPFPEFVEEELEWLSNKDAFPSVETCFDLVSENPEIEVSNHQSPVSVLENSSSSSISNGSSSGNGSTIMSCSGSLQVPTNFPARARSKRRLRKRTTGFGDFSGQQLLWWKQLSVNNNNNRREVLSPLSSKVNNGASIGRRCLHCNADQTPQWRAGPMGPKTLCNACGVRYKSGRLVPEYRPASSPTFSAALHSNSHRKIVEMRKQKQLRMGGYIESEIRMDNAGRDLWI